MFSFCFFCLMWYVQFVFVCPQTVKLLLVKLLFWLVSIRVGYILVQYPQVCPGGFKFLLPYLLFLQMGIFLPLLPFLGLSTANSKHAHYKILPMTGFKLRTSGSGRDISFNWATTTVLLSYLFLCSLILSANNFPVSLSLPNPLFWTSKWRLSQMAAKLTLKMWHCCLFP